MGMASPAAWSLFLPQAETSIHSQEIIDDDDISLVVPIKKGSLEKVSLRCMVTDNRVGGYLWETGAGRGFGLSTSPMLLEQLVYVHARDSGLNVFELNETECSEDATF